MARRMTTLPSCASTSTRSPSLMPTAPATSPGMRTARLFPHRPTIACDIAFNPSWNILRISQLRPVGDVVLALHLIEAGDGAAEFVGAVAGAVDLLGRHLGRSDKEGARLVERVDEDVEALRLVALARPEKRHAFEDDRRVALGDRQVVGGGERAGAQFGER